MSAAEWLRRTPAWRIDVVLAACFVLAGLTSTSQPGAGYEPRDGVAVALILATTVPYCARRRAPLPVFAVSVAAFATMLARLFRPSRDLGRRDAVPATDGSALLLPRHL